MTIGTNFPWWVSGVPAVSPMDLNGFGVKSPNSHGAPTTLVQKADRLTSTVGFMTIPQMTPNIGCQHSGVGARWKGAFVETVVFPSEYDRDFYSYWVNHYQKIGRPQFGK